MTLGGLALAIGMLVDEATVSHREHPRPDGRTRRRWRRAVERGSNETAVPRLLAMLCILSVFIPAFIMAEPVRSLFVPLSLAVGFAMIASYLLSSTLVPVLSVWLLKHHGACRTRSEHKKGSSSVFRTTSSAGWSAGSVRWRWVVVPVYLVGVRADPVAGGHALGTELFPQVDSGQFVLRFRMPPGTNYELTRAGLGALPGSDRGGSRRRTTS